MPTRTLIKFVSHSSYSVYFSSQTKNVGAKKKKKSRLGKEKKKKKNDDVYTARLIESDSSYWSVNEDERMNINACLKSARLVVFGQPVQIWWFTNRAFFISRDHEVRRNRAGTLGSCSRWTLPRLMSRYSLTSILTSSLWNVLMQYTRAVSAIEKPLMTFCHRCLKVNRFDLGENRTNRRGGDRKSRFFQINK